MTSHIAGYEQLCETAAARGFWVTLHTKDHALEYVAVRQPRAKHAIRVAPIRTPTAPPASNAPPACSSASSGRRHDRARCLSASASSTAACSRR
jgi:hypothetical protein